MCTVFTAQSWNCGSSLWNLFTTRHISSRFTLSLPQTDPTWTAPRLHQDTEFSPDTGGYFTSLLQVKFKAEIFPICYCYYLWCHRRAERCRGVRWKVPPGGTDELGSQASWTCWPLIPTNRWMRKSPWKWGADHTLEREQGEKMQGRTKQREGISMCSEHQDC